MLTGRKQTTSAVTALRDARRMTADLAGGLQAARLEDRSTATRQLVDQALRDMSKRAALQA